MKQQSLGYDAPSNQAQFSHHVFLLSSTSEIQRKESLSWLESALATKTLTWSAPDLLDKLLPLLQDANGAVRNRLVKTLQALPKDGLEFLAEKILLHIWAGMTNININVRVSALEVLDWAIKTCGLELVECRGGWYTSLKTYLVMLGWSTIGDASTGWSSNMVLAGNTKNIVRSLDTLTNLLRLGMVEEESDDPEPYADWWISATRMHTRPDPYRELGLYGQNTDESNTFTRDDSERREVFLQHFRTKFEEGIKEVKKQAGEAGRAAAKTFSIISEAMEHADAANTLQNQWTAKMEARNRAVRDTIFRQGFSSGS